MEDGRFDAIRLGPARGNSARDAQPPGEQEIHTRCGELLIAVRIYLGLTQAELAERLGVDSSVVCRDVRNEYHGVTLERAAKVLDAMRVELRTSVEVPDHGVATLPRVTSGSHDAAATDWHEPTLAGRIADPMPRG